MPLRWAQSSRRVAVRVGNVAGARLREICNGLPVFCVPDSSSEEEEDDDEEEEEEESEESEDSEGSEDEDEKTSDEREADSQAIGKQSMEKKPSKEISSDSEYDSDDDRTKEERAYDKAKRRIEVLRYTWILVLYNKQINFQLILSNLSKWWLCQG